MEPVQNPQGTTITKLASLTDADLDNLSDAQKASLAKAVAQEVSAVQPAKSKLDLKDPEILNLLTHLVGQLELFPDSAMAKKFFERLEARLENEGNSLPDAFLKQYNALISRAKFLCLDLLEEDDIAKLLKEGLVKYFSVSTAELGVVDALSKSFVRFVWPPDTEPFVDKIRQALEGNEETIGSKNIEVLNADKKTFIKPSVSNWIKDYLSFQVGLKIGSDTVTQGNNTFGRVNYLNKKTSEYSLTAQQKEILSKVLELEDWLRYGWKEEFEKESKPSLVSEDLKVLIAQLPNEPAVINQPPAVPNPKSALVDEIKTIPRTSVSDITPQNKVARPRGEGSPIDLSNAPGLSLGSMGIKLAPQLQPRAPEIKKPQVDIDKKLEDLENRVDKV